ncbi:MAG TPA: STAS domain-containing protein [Solirubrobacteraceae bacterium]|nr:STAS domain-containing protein [Solirubrobacteraceae bacterium]
MIRPTKFEITDTRDGDRLTLAVTGELDIGSVGVLAERVEATVDPDLSELTLDLRRLDFIDSTGLRSVIELSQRAEQASWRLRLLAPEGEAAQLVFRITGMDAVLPFDEGSPK